MKRLLQFSTVVLGKAHNPTILNPDFLEIRGIVPQAWGWEVEQTLTTPAMSVVVYKHGVSITVEPNKLQVTDTDVENGPQGSKVTEIASAYVKTLPHVPYAAIGNNFQGAFDLDNAGEYLKNRFLKSGPWEDHLDAVGVRFIYPLDDCRLTLSLDAGQLRSSEGSAQNVIITNANFSRDCADGDAEQARAHLGKALEDWSTFSNRFNDLLPPGHEK